MPSTTKSSIPATTDVLIIGGGPTGLAAAIALGRKGVKTLMVERRDGTSTHPRAHTEDARTMEIFRQWGIDEDVRAQGLPRDYLRSVGFFTRMAGIDLGAVVFPSGSEWVMDTEGQGPASLSSTPQDRLEPVLLARARECESVTAVYGWTANDLVQADEVVTATLRDTLGNELAVEAKYVIAADGPRSRVREALGIEMEGPGALGSQLGIYFHADLSEYLDGRKHALYWLYNPEVQGVLIPLDGGTRWHLLFAYDDSRESAEDFPPERCEAIVRGIIGRDDIDIDIDIALPWNMRAQVAKQTHVGRIFLAGDAAHTMPPTGGKGMNTGIGDVHNLAWKIDAVLRGVADPSLLDTYEAERIPVGHFNTMNSLANAAKMMQTGLAGIMTNDPEGFAAIEEDAGADLRARIAEAIPGQFEHFNFDGVSFGYVYKSPLIIDDGTPEVVSGISDYRPSAHPGGRAPHVWLFDGDTKISTIDLADEHFVLLAATSEWAEAAKAAAETTGIALDAYVVGTDDNADLRDPDGEWAKAYEVGHDGAALIRPDGHIAWRRAGAVDDPQAELVTVLRSAAVPVG